MKQAIRSRNDPLYIIHIHCHKSLPGPMPKGNEEIDEFLNKICYKPNNFMRNMVIGKFKKKKPFHVLSKTSWNNNNDN